MASQVQHKSKQTQSINSENRDNVAAKSGSRIESLSRAKPVPFGFIEDRRSVYWDNNLGKDWDNIEPTKSVLSERQLQLIYSKQLHKDYVGDRPSAIWPVSAAAMKATASGRVEMLSEPKALHQDYKPCRQVQTTVSEAAMKAEPSQHIESLSQPKTYAPLKIKSNSEWDWSEWESDLTEAAKNGTASERVLALSDPKPPHRSYKEARPVIWDVSQSAMKALPSLRVQQLARPKSCSQYNEDYDPNVWKVSQGAKSAQATPRIDELAMPIPRKVRTKKVA
ncbi:sperm microtubule associated protein 2-like [Montipora capricornis]|uniref:sperm microtubule associated protein 2-like n=1 Tax=Montipora foliosa TaxID=591990 RepID=UPI0035F15733